MEMVQRSVGLVSLVTVGRLHGVSRSQSLALRHRAGSNSVWLEFLKVGGLDETQYVGLLSVEMKLLWRPFEVFGLQKTKELEILFEKGNGTAT